MSLMQCPACGGNVSTRAKTCPHCGQSTRQPKGNRKFIVEALFLFGFLPALGIWALYEKGKDMEPWDGTATMAQTQTGCREQNDYLRLRELASSGDQEAYTKFHGAAIALGRCAIIPAGTTVYIEDSSVRHHTSRVRPQGKTVGLWTNYVKPW